MKRLVGGALGALAGAAFSTVGLVDTSQGSPVFSGGGNEATPIVIAVGVAIGTLIGATILWRFPFAILGAIVGLAAGMWLRDNLSSGSVQPPWVFLLLFGPPAVGIAGGYLIHLPRSAWARHPIEGAAVLGLAASVIGYAIASFLWATATHDPACDPRPQPDGGVLVLLCPDRGEPLWLALAAGILGLAIGLFAHKQLDPSRGPTSR